MSTPFDNLSPIYEALIDWARRLSNEEPFYRGLFERIKARKVLDVACGTGRHAQMFHSWGLQVEAADISPAMLDAGRRRYGEPTGLRWVERGFDAPVPQPACFDVALCVGNSLALAPDVATVERAVGQMMRAVRPGGAIVIHVLNAWAIPNGPIVWQKSLKHAMADADVLILKGVHRAGSRGFVDLVIQSVQTGQRLRSESVPFLGLEEDAMRQAAIVAGAGEIQFIGGYHGQAYERENSVDLIMVAFR